MCRMSCQYVLHIQIMGWVHVDHAVLPETSREGPPGRFARDGASAVDQMRAEEQRATFRAMRSRMEGR